MQNLLSFQDKKFLGKEIREWAEYQIMHDTSSEYLARRVLNMDIVDERTYLLLTAHGAEGYHRGWGTRSPKIELRRVK